MSDFEIAGHCENCGASGIPVQRLTGSQYAGQMQCELCSGMPSGEAHSERGRALAYCTNAILRALRATPQTEE